MMNPAERTQLERNRLLRDISLENVEHILEDCRVIALNSGKTLLEIGQKNNSLYLVLEGELHVCLDSRSLNEHAVLGSGECVGELSLIDGGNTSAQVIAAQDTRLLAVPHDHVWSLVDNSNGIARNLLGILAGRIRNDNLLQVTTDEHSLEFEVAANLNPLTGLHNRNWMEEAFPRMMLRCARSHSPLCMLIMDIDRFRDFSITNGHLAGDSVVKAVAQLITKKLRTQDLLACMVIDRFAALLPDTPLDVAMGIAERLREAVEEASLHPDTRNGSSVAGITPAGQDKRITISIGVAAMQPEDRLDKILAAAEEALSQSKAAGRNNVKMAVTGKPLHA